MKLLIILTICATFAAANAVLSQQAMLLVRPKLLQCAKENNVTDAELQAIIANDLSNQSRNIQCLSFCFFKSLGMMDGNGNLNVLTSIAAFSFGERPCTVIRVVNMCKNLKGTDACNTASLIYACYVRNQLL